jgi:hypothetical protein
MTNNETIDIIDTKLYVLGETYNVLKTVVVKSVIDYFNRFLNNFIIVFTIFFGLLIVALIYYVFFAFNRLKKTMWNTNLLLKIIPISDIDKHDKEDLKDFFSN